jgi:hypothetical protein
MNYQEYRDYCFRRDSIISQNRSRIMKGMDAIPTPAKIAPPRVPVAYRGRDYVGRLKNTEECPKGCTVKYDIAQW